MMMICVKVIVPRRNWTRLTDMVDELHTNYSAAAYTFRNSPFFLDLPPEPQETSNITFLRHRRKVSDVSLLTGSNPSSASTLITDHLRHRHVKQSAFKRFSVSRPAT